MRFEIHSITKIQLKVSGCNSSIQENIKEKKVHTMNVFRIYLAWKIGKRFRNVRKSQCDEWGRRRKENKESSFMSKHLIKGLKRDLCEYDTNTDAVYNLNQWIWRGLIPWGHAYWSAKQLSEWNKKKCLKIPKKILKQKILKK